MTSSPTNAASSELDAFLFHNFFKTCALVLNSLTDVLKFQVAGAEGDGFGDALGDESRLDAGKAGERDRCAIMSVKAFGFDQRLAVETEPALAAMFGRLFAARSVACQQARER